MFSWIKDIFVKIRSFIKPIDDNLDESVEDIDLEQFLSTEQDFSLDTDDEKVNQDFLNSLPGSSLDKWKKMLFSSPILLPLETTQTENLVEPIVEIVYKDDLRSSFGNYSYNHKTNTLTVELAPWVTEWVLHIPNFNKILQSDIDPPLGYITAHMSEDVMLMPSCKFYIPSEAQVSIGAKLPKSWEFSRANRNPQCSNPAITEPDKYADCNAYPNLLTCRAVVPEGWTDIKIGTDNEDITFKIQRQYIACKLSRYRVVTTDFTSMYDSFEEALEFFDMVHQQYIEAEINITITDCSDEEPVKEYLSSVLVNQ